MDTTLIRLDSYCDPLRPLGALVGYAQGGPGRAKTPKVFNRQRYFCQGTDFRMRRRLHTRDSSSLELLLRKRVRCARVEFEAKRTVVARRPLTLTLSPPGERGNGSAAPRARRGFFHSEWCAAWGSLREVGTRLEARCASLARWAPWVFLEYGRLCNPVLLMP